MSYIIFAIGVLVGAIVSNIAFRYRSGYGTFEIVESDTDTCVGIKFTSPITNDTRTIILKNSRR